MDKFNGSAMITNDGIKKHFKNYEPIQVLIEMIWNGLDAEAKKIEILLNKNELDLTDEILIIDDGKGIDIEHIESNFSLFNDSLKINDKNQHGANGRGRLSFYKLCSDASWFTKFEAKNARINIIKKDSVAV